ncbi:hypothetical protein K492DRAFT_200222 [Lichtheimia hyalospora FSU 10163]|nr:hypothetical protein K492DRAFT_200222 [Lichtheimia hyalospora FSU 10163]
MTKKTTTTTFSLNKSPSRDPMSPSETHGYNYEELISELPLDLVMSNILPWIFVHGLTVIDLHQPFSHLDKRDYHGPDTIDVDALTNLILDPAHGCPLL